MIIFISYTNTYYRSIDNNNNNNNNNNNQKINNEQDSNTISDTQCIDKREQSNWNEPVASENRNAHNQTKEKTLIQEPKINLENLKRIMSGEKTTLP